VKLPQAQKVMNSVVVVVAIVVVVVVANASVLMPMVRQ
jgi:hypothetical protein